MGELMVQSHQSYSACGLGTTQTDRLVTLALEKRNQGVYGAKITGGGSGGTVCFLAVGDEGKNAVGAIHRQYQQEVKKSVVMFEA
jgi:L-arabinokinase